MIKYVAILGASDKKDRYSHQALMLLKEFGHNTYCIHPKLSSIDGEKVFSSINEINTPVDTLTVYVNEEISKNLVNDIINLAPKRIIFNPGSENPAIYDSLKESGIEVEEACTLVLLRTGQF